MLKPIRSILFATDLTPNSQRALDFTIALATRFHATIYMLYVVEKLPEQMTERLKDLLGHHQWENLVDAHQMTAHKSLLNKQSTNFDVRKAIHDFCKQEGIDNDSCDFQSREIIISGGNVVKNILIHSEENECDLIVLGGHQSFFSKAPSIGSTAKGVMKKSSIPVTVVPPAVT